MMLPLLLALYREPDETTLIERLQRRAPPGDE